MSRHGMLGRLPLALYGLANDRLAEVFELIKLLGGEDGPAWTAYLRKVRTEGLPTLQVQPPAPKPSVLKLDAHIELDGVDSYDPKKLTTRPGLWVSDEFVSRVRSGAKLVENLGSLSLGSHELTKNVPDRSITPELGKNYLFDGSELCARIEQMIAKQPNGEEGDLLNNGYANLFYVVGCVVRVYWYAFDRRWHVRAWERGSYQWFAGSRAFSRN